MAAIKELLRSENDGSLSFGDYELDQKTKLSDFSYRGDVYKVKTYKDITRLEKNDALVYESVPGTAVSSLTVSDGSISFTVEGPEDADLVIEMGDEKTYEVLINGESTGTVATGLGGKLSFSVELSAGKPVQVVIREK